jgi:hypothetical protein
MLFEPEVEADEQIAAAHLLNFELGYAGSAIAPGDGNDGPGVAADDGLQRDFDGEIEVRGEERLATFNDSAAIGLERVGGVVERMPKSGG